MSLPNDVQRITLGLAKLETSNSSYDGSKISAARTLARPVVTLVKQAADAAASTTTAVTASLQVTMPRAGRLLGAVLVPSTAETADATNYATVLVQKHDGAAGAATTMASLALDVAGGNWVAGTKKTMALGAAAATRFASGEVIGLALTKAGTGLLIDPLCVALHIEWEGTDSYEVL